MSILKYYDGTKWKDVNGQVTGDTLPIGSIIPYGGLVPPTGWLLCWGQTVNKSSFPELFDAIGYAFGGEEGEPTFGIPNLKGKVVVGQDTSQTEFNEMGKTGGSKYLQEHYHTNQHYAVGTNAPGYGSWEGPVATTSGDTGVYLATANTTNTGTGNAGNLQPYMVTNYIIKAKQVAGLVGAVTDSFSNSTTDTYSCNYINDKLLYDSGWKNASLENNWTSISGRTMKYRKIGNVVYVQGTITGGTYSAGTRLFSLPEGYRNTMNYQKFIGEYFGTTGQVGFIYVSTNGDVKLDIELPGNNEFSITFSFLAD